LPISRRLAASFNCCATALGNSTTTLSIFTFVSFQKLNAIRVLDWLCLFVQQLSDGHPKCLAARNVAFPCELIQSLDQWRVGVSTNERPIFCGVHASIVPFL
jgi:hypothetical protein